MSNSQPKFFYSRDEMGEEVKEAKIIYFLLGLVIGAVLMFTGLIALGIGYGL